MLTGRWQGPITTDRMRSVVLNPHWMLTILDRMLDPQGPVSIDRLRPIAEFLLWNLTGVGSVWSLDHSASDRTERNLLDQMN